MWWKDVRHREMGVLHPNSFARRFLSLRLSSLRLSNRKEIVSPHRGAVNSLEVDLTERRYLLSGASDGSAAVYDIQQTTDYEAGGLISKHNCLFAVDKQFENGHKFAISSAKWYPIDTGLFVTGSYDHFVKVWDTNATQVVLDFKMPGRVHGVAMSPIATNHMLIAAGSADVQVRLCDIASRAFTHTLSGHRDGIIALEWSISSEWVLMTGGCDGAIRFWDIRRAGCFLVLDQSNSQHGRRPPLLNQIKRTTAETMPFPKKSPLVTKKLSSLQRVHSKKVPSAPRLHPGMSSSYDPATAHYGAVTGLKATTDGMYLLSSGSDSRLRLWDIESGCNTLVNFDAIRLQTSKALQISVSPDSSLVFVPCMASIKAFDLWSGTTVQTFRGHYESVNCCYYNSQDQELYTGSNDRQILVWSPLNPVVAEVDDDVRAKQMHADQDAWSD